ncbi:hypothetical protein M434DRAFT_397021 [Hypoxylon sp. CO27-5]|nr:hypothetical protein M434DRAFT_397021 [Hypoxylon sp. CO27-5]
MATSLLEEEPSDNNASTETRTGRSSSVSSRPSFTDYWKRTKRAARHITFVSSSLEQPTGPNKDDRNTDDDNGEQPDLSSQAKAQARRAQVRKAQIQHRQRKANYTKQLEMDIAKLRDLIEQTERESLALRTENEGIRQLLLANDPSPSSTGFNFGFSQPEIGTTPTAVYSPPQPIAPEYTVSLLGSSDSTNTPVYQVARTSTPSSSSARSAFSGSQGSPNTEAFPGAPPLSEAETDHAINFILALEHICWNHFNPSHYSHTDYDPEAKEHGHILMATSIALQNAPPRVWDQINAEKERIQKGPSATTSNPSSRPPSLPPLPFESNYSSSGNGHSHSHSYSHPHPHRHPHSHSHANNPPSTNPNLNPNAIASWPSPPPPLENVGAGLGLGLTLSSLHGLASTLIPADQELAPVQAWFEIARLYGAAAVRDAARMDAVREELARGVECQHFGAVIQRRAFEDVVARVFGRVPVSGVPGAGGDWGWGVMGRR